MICGGTRTRNVCEVVVYITLHYYGILQLALYKNNII